MRPGMVSVTLRMNLEDAFSAGRALEGDKSFGDDLLDGVRGLEGGALSVTSRIPLEGFVGLLKAAGTGKREEEVLEVLRKALAKALGE